MRYIEHINRLIQDEIRHLHNIVLFGQNISTGSCLGGLTRKLNVTETSRVINSTNAENSLVDGVSHDAMVDVEVTLELSKRLREFDRRTWDYLINGFKKNEDSKRLSSLPHLSISQNNYSYGLITDISIGYKVNCIAPVLILGTHLEYDNQIMLLRLDSDMNSPQLIKRKIMSYNWFNIFVLSTMRIIDCSEL